MTTVPAERSPFAELPTRSCPECEANRSVARFCPGCRRFLEAPDVGRLASKTRRIGAAILDSMFQGGGLAGAVLPAALGGSFLGSGIVGAVSIAYWIFTLYLWTKGTTPAKKVFDLSVIREDGEPASFWRMALREAIGKPISMAMAGLGVLWIQFDRQRQGWHDKIAGTFVVEDED